MATAKLKTKKKLPKKLNLSQIRNHLDDLDNIRTLVTNFEKDSVLHKKSTMQSISDIEVPMKLRVLNSEIKEYEELNEKLESLSFNLGLLRTTVFTKNHREAIRISQKFISSDYSRLTLIVDGINSFQNKINELDIHYSKLMKSIPTNLDFKVREETSYENHIKSLKNINEKQKLLVSNIGNVFLDLTKRIIKANRENI